MASIRGAAPVYFDPTEVRSSDPLARFRPGGGGGGGGGDEGGDFEVSAANKSAR